jgi:hypothetical protein
VPPSKTAPPHAGCTEHLGKQPCSPNVPRPRTGAADRSIEGEAISSARAMTAARQPPQLHEQTARDGRADAPERATHHFARGA